MLDRLDARDASSGMKDKRKHPRVPFRKPDVEAMIGHPGGSMTVRRVYTRDLSAQGLACIASGYVHVGSDITVKLPKRLGGVEDIHGTVVACWHVRGSWHHLNVRFNSPINPRVHVEKDAWRALEREGEAAVATVLRGKAVVWVNSELDRELIRFYLGGTKVTFDMANGSWTKQDLVAKCPDVLITDLKLGGEVLELLRRAMPGRAGRRPATLAIADMLPSADAAAPESPAAQLAATADLPLVVLHRPLEQTSLLAAIRACLGSEFTCLIDNPIYSELPTSDATDHLIGAFVIRARDVGERLGTYVRTDETAAARAAATEMRSYGEACGFPTVASAARSAVAGIDATMSAAESADALKHLIDQCRRVSSRPPVDLNAARRN
jgi:hypothetical protein